MSRESPRKVLVTGGTGYIGSHTCVAFIESGFEPVIVDNLCNSHPAVLDRIARITGHRPAFFQADIRDVDALDRILGEHSFDAVIHFAGLKAVGESVLKPLDYYLNNVQGSLILFDALLRAGVRKLIFSSSAVVYGTPDKVPVPEMAPLRPENPYGQTKAVIEAILRDMHRADASWRIGILRYFNPVGAHESGLIGEEPRGVPENLMPFIAQVAVGREKQLRVFGNDYPTPDGTGIRDYIHVMDLAEGHLAALKYLSRQPSAASGQTSAESFQLASDNCQLTTGVLLPPDGCQLPTSDSALSTFNLGTGRGYSVLEVVRAFETVTGKHMPLEVAARRPGDVAASYADAAFAHQLLGWRATRGIEDMCRDAWRWQSQNPDGYPH